MNDPCISVSYISLANLRYSIFSKWQVFVLFKIALVLSLNLVLFEIASAASIDIQISSGEDDSEESIPNGSVNFLSSDLELGMDKRGEQIVAMRFNNVNLAGNTRIFSAYIQFTVDEKKSAPTTLLIEGEATNSAAPLTNTKFDLSRRSRTVANIPWSPPPWLTVGASGPDQQTPNLGPIIQEIVNQPDWLAGNSLVLFVTGSGVRTAESFNGVQASAPVLHIEFDGATISRCRRGCKY